jgi:c-di-GMP-binding flagellar brake protein YcgR
MSSQEERKHRRAPLPAHVRLVLGEGAQQLVLRGAIADISLGGIGLHLVHPLEVGIEVTLELSFPVIGVGLKNETVKGKTIYSYHVQDTYYVGIEFDQELNPLHQPYLCKRIQDILESF